MKQSSSFIICILTVAALLANVACSKPEPVDITINTKPPEVSHSFHCSHKVGSTASAEDTIELTYKIGNRVVMDYTITTQTNGGHEIDGSGFHPSISFTAGTLKLCWGEDNCFEMTRNKDKTWTIKSLPFVE